MRREPVNILRFKYKRSENSQISCLSATAALYSSLPLSQHATPLWRGRKGIHILVLYYMRYLVSQCHRSPQSGRRDFQVGGGGERGTDGGKGGGRNLNAQLVPCLRSGKKTAEAIVSRAAKAEGGSVAKWWCACIYERREGPSLGSREKRGAPPWMYVAGLRCDWRQCNNPILQLCPLCSTQCAAVVGLRGRTCYSSVFV